MPHPCGKSYMIELAQVTDHHGRKDSFPYFLISLFTGV